MGEGCNQLHWGPTARHRNNKEVLERKQEIMRHCTDNISETIHIPKVLVLFLVAEPNQLENQYRIETSKMLRFLLFFYLLRNDTLPTVGRSSRKIKTKNINP